MYPHDVQQVIEKLETTPVDTTGVGFSYFTREPSSGCSHKPRVSEDTHSVGTRFYPVGDPPSSERVEQKWIVRETITKHLVTGHITRYLSAYSTYAGGLDACGYCGAENGTTNEKGEFVSLRMGFDCHCCGSN